MTRKEILWKQLNKLEKGIDNPPPLCDYEHSHAVAEISRELRSESVDKLIILAFFIALSYLLFSIGKHGK